MTLLSRFIHLGIAIVLTVMGAALIYFQSALLYPKQDEVHPVDKKMERRLDEIVVILNTLGDKDPAAVGSVASLFAEIVEEENNRTALLQQRASSLLSSTALVISIIFTSVSLMFKDARGRLGIKDFYFLSYLFYAILFVFGASLYWTWMGFGARPFVSFNSDNLLDNMGNVGADLHTSQVVAVIQRYQINKINAGLNAAKVAALRWAVADLFLGLLLFSLFCLFLLIRMDKLDSDKGAGDGNEKK